MSQIPTRVAPGVHRIGDDIVNFYLVEAEDCLVMVDAGLPSHSRRLLDALAHLEDRLCAVVLTHAHPDHVGLAETVRARTGAQVWVHEADAQALDEGQPGVMHHLQPECRVLPYLMRRPSALRPMMLRGFAGALMSPMVREYRSFGHDQILREVPGRPRVLSVPGHTPGSTVVVFDDRAVAFTGDALVTYDCSTGHRGPCVVSRAFTQDSEQALESLEQVAELPDETLMLPGHGAPFAEKPRIAVLRARATGVR
ncbi:MBL fold metallo-hydrolase [Nocardiopsis salina]|uniref:MBL fold metallo-hydrolase n=1 Tax=Nocardiopsis salina TaxID=245836 RepID=UPI00034C892A|nr:MBL fold metallo-hydrolase [Nocardiopsis salina]